MVGRKIFCAQKQNCVNGNENSASGFADPSEVLTVGGVGEALLLLPTGSTDKLQRPSV